MDGHTTHINLAISEFCYRNDIILYCFLPHASHIMQPLDISVYGPLKLFWRQALTNFKTKYNLNMNRSHFFTVFDEAWEEARSRPANVVSGFRKAGILPFDSTAIDYTRLIDATASVNVLQETSKFAFQQRVGQNLAFKKLESTLEPETLTIFQRRFSEDYDIKSKSYESQLYQVYKNLRLLSESAIDDHAVTDCDNATTDHAVTDCDNATTDHDVTDCDNATTDHDVTDCDNAMIDHADTDYDNATIDHTDNATIIDGSYLEDVQTIVIDAGDLSSVTEHIQRASSPVPGPSNAPDILNVSNQSSVDTNQSRDSRRFNSLPKYYQAWEDSPFKKYLKIGESVLQSKQTLPKPKMPPAISGTDYFDYMERKKIEKETLEKEKNDRKQQRLEKKQLNQKHKNKSVKRRLYTEVEISEGSIHYDDDDDIEINESEEACAACGGENRKDEPQAWIGCEYCFRWFHKECQTEDYSNTSEDKLKALDFKCNVCSKSKRVKQSRK